ncbi:MAG: hypothetical protein SV760_08880, partial [Halobacteria archaeon]|nr:hypothetical protein [Halobacteria archaeon]
LGGLTYVVGDSVDIMGTASPGIDTVALYVQGDGGNWHLLPLNGEKTTDVTLGTWEARDVVLSDESFGGRLLRFPGVYTVSAVDADDIGSPPPRILGSSEMEKVTGSESTIRVTTPVFFTRFSTVGGEVARGDGVGVRGVSVGSEEVVVGFIGKEGSVTASVERTSRGSAFESRDIRLDSLGEGNVTAFGIVEGRDGVFGDELAENGEGNTVSLRTRPVEWKAKTSTR